MFVLRFKPDTYRLLWDEAKKAYVSTNIGGRFFCERPTKQTGYTTKNLDDAKVFNHSDGKTSSLYFADCEPVTIKIELV